MKNLSRWKKYKKFLFSMWHSSAVMVVTISLHFAPYSTDLRFFCLALKGAGSRPHHVEDWSERMCSSQTAKPREVPCTCFSNYQLGSFENISGKRTWNNGITLFLRYCQCFWQQLSIIMINFVFIFIPFILIALFITFFSDTTSTQGAGGMLHEEWARNWKEVVFG